MQSKFHYSVPKSLPLVPVPSHINPVHTISSLSCKLHFNIILPPWMWSLSPPETYMQVSAPQHKPHASNCPQSEDPNNIWWSVQITKLLILQFSPASCHFPLLKHIYFPQLEKTSFTPIQNNKQNWFPYILTLLLLHRKQKYKLYYTKWQQTLLRFNLPWNSTSIQFWRVSVAPNVWILTNFQMIYLLSFAVILFTTYEHALSFVLHSVLLTYTQSF